MNPEQVKGVRRPQSLDLGLDPQAQNGISFEPRRPAFDWHIVFVAVCRFVIFLVGLMVGHKQTVPG